jgi:hypothetical protein
MNNLLLWGNIMKKLTIITAITFALATFNAHAQEYSGSTEGYKGDYSGGGNEYSSGGHDYSSGTIHDSYNKSGGGNSYGGTIGGGNSYDNQGDYHPGYGSNGGNSYGGTIGGGKHHGYKKHYYHDYDYRDRYWDSRGFWYTKDCYKYGKHKRKCVIIRLF